MGILKINISGPSTARWSYDAGTTWIIPGYAAEIAAGTYAVVFNSVLNYNSPLPIVGIVVGEFTETERSVYYTEIESSAIYGNTNFNDFCAEKEIPNPSFDTNLKAGTNILKAKFGDGYSQRGLNGLHPVETAWSVSWSELELEKIKELEKYFTSRMGIRSFIWTPIRYEHQVAKRFIAPDWNRGYVGFTHDRFAVTFEQVFDIS